MPRPLLAGVVGGCFLSGAHLADNSPVKAMAALDRALVDPALAGAAQLRGEIHAKLYGGRNP